MPKRPNPFIDDFQPQLKIHVGPKEYRNTEDKMKSIYEKTIGILFEGANQKNNNNGVIDISETVPNAKEPETSLQNKTMKQMFFGKNGVLQTNGGQIQRVEAPVQCPLCRQQPAELWLSCGYCEGPQCCGCALLCTSCNSATCANCSVDRGSSGIFCLSCCR